ncbi:glycosyltransferase family 2 protein [Candidatus Woesearchaeota archaeon]|jgi:UDP-N-acetylglucosamine---dolichyl-phosphate N-acetylglucosaminyltransferase|nr:glycosyltransferase family 2 protein [Candidatus Woesearchaeota archaeon]MBT4368862.1 glycosyltransferase family 2 protein [Candidatus Woesearchaeota archaeon]MBT4712151.1 glycosyltransferase family 2 protein [Candidatus Woesearchaeota archaeon]MBT6639101.1 glycosyltransferase family 2 protein [Candidatus Woesearchaeota archaeon]MBT7134301.1 glycosyltransferase family 2 protein [Candidatus Woesearchaeota archaeon]
MEPNETFVVIPAHNEEKHIGKVLKDVKTYVKNIILVDDGSKDSTSKIAKTEKVTVLRHITNLGKGAALKTGCDYAISRGAKHIIVMDADGQHEPKLIPNFITKLKEKDLVFGYRIPSKNMPFIFRAGNFAIDKITKLLYRINLRDTQSGFRAFTSETYKKIRWQANDYSMESEMIARAGRNNINYCEIPITTIYGDKYKGTTTVDGIKIVLNLIKWKLFNL